jgi:hypothetical protein
MMPQRLNTWRSIDVIVGAGPAEVMPSFARGGSAPSCAHHPAAMVDCNTSAAGEFVLMPL